MGALSCLALCVASLRGNVVSLLCPRRLLLLYFTYLGWTNDENLKYEVLQNEAELEFSFF